MRKSGTLMTLLLLAVAAETSASAEVISHCSFDTVRLEFAGTPIEQARCLLTPIKIRGNLGDALPRLGDVLEARVGRPAEIDRAKLSRLLRREGLDPLANKLARPVAKTAEGLPARYFVIHDTSQEITSATWPANDAPSLNRLGAKHEDGTWVAHMFVNRLGKLLAAYDFETPWRATQLEGKAGARSRGRFLHVEHNQPRRRDPANPRKNDNLAPSPGLTAAQYDRSTLLYIVASARAGRWLIPAFHGVMDTGVGDHDDPQNFDRAAWEAALLRNLQRLDQSVAAVTPPAGNVTPLRASLYYTALEGDYPADSDAAFRSRTGTILHRGSRTFFDKAAIEGSAKLSDGRVINVDGVVGGERRWIVIPQKYGLDAVGCGLVPFRSAAVDRSVIPLRTRLVLPETIGMRLPNGMTHDGVWYAVDTGAAIQGDRIDLYLGAGKATMDIPRAFGIGHLQPLQARVGDRVTGCARPAG